MLERCLHDAALPSASLCEDLCCGFVFTEINLWNDKLCVPRDQHRNHDGSHPWDRRDKVKD